MSCQWTLDLQMSVRADLASMGSCLQGGWTWCSEVSGMSSTAWSLQLIGHWSNPCGNRKTVLTWMQKLKYTDVDSNRSMSMCMFITKIHIHLLFHHQTNMISPVSCHPHPPYSTVHRGMDPWTLMGTTSHQKHLEQPRKSSQRTHFQLHNSFLFLFFSQ